MNKTIAEKEKLLKMMTEIYDQLEELETVLESSFSDLRNNWISEEQKQIESSLQKLVNIEDKLETAKIIPQDKKELINQNHKSASLKFELGF